MTIESQWKLRYYIIREAANISALSLGKINTYEYLTGEDLNLFFLLWENFWKTNKSSFRSRKKQVDALKTLKPKEDKSDDNEKHLKYTEVFNELSNERIGEIYNISKEIDFNNLAYCYKGPNLALINFIDFRGPMHFHNEIKKVK